LQQTAIETILRAEGATTLDGDIEMVRFSEILELTLTFGIAASLSLMAIVSLGGLA
jgi:hypothetical protein